jgi:Ran GTPase-activating protein (RanGAP) involved in mRNA processing and transport
METVEELIEQLDANDPLLTKVDAGSRKIDDGDGQSIVYSVFENTFVTEIDLSSNYIGTKCADSVGRLLEVNTKVVKVNVSLNEIYEGSSVRIAEALKVNKTLQELNISYQEDPYSDGISVAEAFADMLDVNQTLTSLDLGGNKISPKGIALIATALTKNSWLLSLGLDSNIFTDDSDDESDNESNDNESNDDSTKQSDSSCDSSDVAACAMVNMLKINNSLKKLSLKDIVISAADLSTIIVALQQNRGLTHLDLSYNAIEDDVAAVIANMLKINTTLKILNLSDNRLISTDFEKIASALQCNVTLTNLNLEFNDTDNVGIDAMLMMVQDWNDTLQDLKLPKSRQESDCKIVQSIEKIECLIKENKAGSRIAPYKAERFHRGIFVGLLSNWVHVKQVKHKRRQAETCLQVPTD